MSLESLPDELLVEIVKNLHPIPGPQFDKAHWGLLAESESQDIASFANTSRRFYNLARAQLYSSFIQNGDGNLALFVRTLIARPELQAHVRFVNVVPGRSDPENLIFKQSFTDQDRTRLFRALEPISTNTWEGCDFHQHLHPSYVGWSSLLGWSTLVTLLLSLPQLQELHIPDFGRADVGHLDPIYCMLQRAAKLQETPVSSLLAVQKPLLPLAMQNLRRLSIGWDGGKRKDPKNDWGSIDIKHAIPWLTLRSIESFHGIELRTDPVAPQSWQRWNGFEVALGITELKLSRCNLTKETLFDFLTPFKRLVSFHYEEGGSDVGAYDCDPRGVLPALSHLHSTLKKFTFINRHTTYDSQMERATLGSFAAFTKLEDIDTMAFSLIPSNVSERELEEKQRLCLFEILPPTLKHLKIREFETRDRTLIHVSKMIKLKKYFAPSLNKIILERKGDIFADGEINWIWKGLKSMGVKPEMERARHGGVRLARVVMTC